VITEKQNVNYERFRKDKNHWEPPVKVSDCPTRFIHTCRVYKSADSAAKTLVTANVLPRKKFAALMKAIGSKLNEGTYGAILA
jgi:hypothetical protein